MILKQTCETLFCHKVHLRRHKETDIGEKKFTCKACGNLFEEPYLQDMRKSILPGNTVKETQVIVHAGHSL